LLLVFGLVARYRERCRASIRPPMRSKGGPEAIGRLLLEERKKKAKTKRELDRRTRPIPARRR